MAEQVVGPHQTPEGPPANGLHVDERVPLALPPNMIIEITEQRRKKEVIALDDSEEDRKPLPTRAPLRPKDRKPPVPEQRKVRKLASRCLLCKEPGKKSAMRACLDCRGLTHLLCLEQLGESGLRYRCRKCRSKREQAAAAQGKAGDGKGVQGGGKRVQKEKRREEQQKKMYQFQVRYPYYFQEDRIKFPIEDKLLFIYRELFEFAEAPKPTPQQHDLIPAGLLGDFLQIENFFSTFREELVAYSVLPGQLSKSVVYLSLASEGLDGVFCGLVDCLLKIYLSDIFDKNKTDNVRILNDHPFFTLLTHLHDNNELSQEVIVRASQEVLRYLATIPSMKRAFEDLPSLPSALDLTGKAQLLLCLIRGLSEVDEFHSLVSIKSERMQQLTKEKTELVAQLKVDQAQNLSNGEKLKDMTQAGLEMEVQQEGVTRQLTKELDKHKKKMQRLASQQTRTEETIKDIRAKIAEIGRAMPFLTSQIEFLGLDRNNSEYFFYVREPDRLYVKFRSYLLDRSEDFLVYIGKQAITEVIRSLNTKGLHERHLYDSIVSLMKDEIFNFAYVPPTAEGFMLEENKYHPIELEDVLRLIRETEATFSVYLSLRQFQWAAPSVRELFMAQLSATTDLQLLKEQMRSMQESFLFAEYSSPEAGAYQLQDDELGGMDRGEGRKKVPIRIWGINSEKTKKYWVQYLQECIDVAGLWICAYVFKNNVDKYVKKKMDAYYGQQQKDRPKPRARGRPPINRDRTDRYQRIQQKMEKKSSSLHEPSPSEEQAVVSVSDEDFNQEQEQQQQSRRPNLRKRNAKKMNIVRAGVTQDSDVEEMEPEEEDSSNEEICEICGDYGDMLCCDTCPKVYHKDCLKMKDVPEGDWSCFKCLERISNERQTRSRVRKMGKFM